VTVTVTVTWPRCPEIQAVLSEASRIATSLGDFEAHVNFQYRRAELYERTGQTDRAVAVLKSLLPLGQDTWRIRYHFVSVSEVNADALGVYEQALTAHTGAVAPQRDSESDYHHHDCYTDVFEGIITTHSATVLVRIINPSHTHDVQTYSDACRSAHNFAPELAPLEQNFAPSQLGQVAPRLAGLLVRMGRFRELEELADSEFALNSLGVWLVKCQAGVISMHTMFQIARGACIVQAMCALKLSLGGSGEHTTCSDSCEVAELEAQQICRRLRIVCNILTRLGVHHGVDCDEDTIMRMSLDQKRQVFEALIEPMGRLTSSNERAALAVGFAAANVYGLGVASTIA
jgi:hypothetical protein